MEGKISIAHVADDFKRTFVSHRSLFLTVPEYIIAPPILVRSWCRLPHSLELKF